ncbi:hypothetical protein OIB37_12675 [Streptomyces sp. NBC_00820]|uniref:hypothetical protein n=1 Tax=Streptomyces sp. NBC_00820 TaxID=2975842 RepID=UPI002ED122F2|nr:hypothetical protein OIB37_12675 [Streptomyces sp. NBC_00820]
MKETGESYQAALRGLRDERTSGESGANRPPLPNANRREDYIDAVWDADLPQMSKVVLFELAARLDLTVDDWSEDSHQVRFEDEELARCVGLDEEAANLSRDLAAEAGWLVEVECGVVELRQPHEDWDLYLGMLKNVKDAVADRAVYRSRLAAFEADTKRLRTAPMMTIRALREGMMMVLGHTYVPRCVGGRFARNSAGLGSGKESRGL